MGIVSDSDFESELSRLSGNSDNPAEIIDITKGRGKGSKEVPESLRKIIGETNELDGRSDAIELAKRFGISSSSVSAYGHGSTSTASYNKPNEELKNHINESKDRIAKKARGRLFNALKHITDEKLSQARVKDVSSVARDMAAIIKDVEPDNKSEASKQSPQFVFYAPQFRDERSFDVIKVKE